MQNAKIEEYAFIVIVNVVSGANQIFDETKARVAGLFK